MSYEEITHIEISCDYPGCGEYLIFGYEGIEKIQKMMHAIGWTYFDFPGEDDSTPYILYFCAKCRNKDPDLIGNHKCIYVRKTKKGDISIYGHTLECYFCGRIKQRRKD